MSTYSKNGLRQVKLAERKQNKAHIRAFHKILEEMDVIARGLDPSLEYNEENINEYVSPILGRDLDSMEKFVMLGKLNHGKE
jgi:hypothetical protein